MKKKQKIICNRIKCNKCGDIIISNSGMVLCSCKSVAVDGGHYWLRRCYFDRADWAELSIVDEIEVEED